MWLHLLLLSLKARDYTNTPSPAPTHSGQKLDL
jgi:hypothetical protein